MRANQKIKGILKPNKHHCKDSRSTRPTAINELMVVLKSSDMLVEDSECDYEPTTEEEYDDFMAYNRVHFDNHFASLEV